MNIHTEHFIFLKLYLHIDDYNFFRFVGHTDAVNDVCFAPKVQLMASGSKDRTVRLWIPTVRGEC